MPFSDLLRLGMARGGLPPAMSPIGVGNVLRDVCPGALSRWVNQPPGARSSSLADELQQSLRLLLEGMAFTTAPASASR